MAVRTTEELTGLAKEIAAAGKAGTKLPVWDPDYGPGDLEDAYRLQAATVHEIKPLAGSPYGYKIGATNKGAQDALKTDRPFYGRLMKNGHLKAPCDIAYSALNHALVEIEFAVELKSNLPAQSRPYSVEQVKKAARRVILSIEVVSTRFEVFPDAGALNYIGDNGAGGVWVEGPSEAAWIHEDLEAVGVELLKGGVTVASGNGAVVESGPFGMLTWLANQGLGLKAGEIITTGTLVPPTPAVRGDSFTARFKGMGDLTVRFGA